MYSHALVAEDIEAAHPVRGKLYVTNMKGSTVNQIKETIKNVC